MPNSGIHQRHTFKIPVPDAMVFGQYNPSAVVRHMTAIPRLWHPEGNSRRGRGRWRLPDGERQRFVSFQGERSRKKTEGSGSFDPEFAPDGFFDFEALAAIIVCQIVH